MQISEQKAVASTGNYPLPDRDGGGSVPPTHYDLIVIGGGPGGYQAAAAAASKGLSVLIAEQGEAGGTCLNRGCIPTKSLCHDAELIAAARSQTVNSQLSPFNSPAALAESFAKAMERKEQVVSQLRSGVEQLLSAPGITLTRGHATLGADCVVRIESTVAQGNMPSDGGQPTVTTATADNIIIATGSRSRRLPIPGIDLPGVVTSTGLLSSTSLPPRLCVIGAGVIGLELAVVCHTFGSEVTVVEYCKECLPAMDSDIAKRLRKQLERTGITFEMGAAVTSISEGLHVNIEKKGRTTAIEADMVLVATGREAVTDAIDTEGLHILTDRRGICVDATTFEVLYAEGAPHPAARIFAIGDVNGRQMLAHAAEAQAHRVVNTIVGEADQLRLDVMPAAVFTTPEVAAVGPTEETLKNAATPYEVHKATFRANGRALCIGQTEGLVKVLTSPDGHILACHAMGPHAADIVQEVTAYITLHATLSQLKATIHIHPTLSEVLVGV